MADKNIWHINQNAENGFWYFMSINEVYELGPYRDRETCERAIPLYLQYLGGKMDFGKFLIKSEVLLWDK